MILPRASLKRSPRTRTWKDTTCMDTDIGSPPLHSSSLVRRKTRPPPLQIIPELSENDPNFDATHSPATARPLQLIPQQSDLVSSRITLSAYTFSIDDALLMFGDAPRSPALSASSSTSDGASSEGVPTTPRTSDEEDGCDFILPTPRLRPQRVTIRPLCITKTRSLICQEDEDHFDKEEDNIISLAMPEEMPGHLAQDKGATEAVEEAEQDFYTREFEDFISLPTAPSLNSPARRDSLVLVTEALPDVVEVPEEPKLRGRSRHSKPLPLLPPASPAVSSLPSIPTFPLVQTTAQKSLVRRKRNILPLANHPPSPPAASRPLPRMAVPLDIEDCVFPEENFGVPSRNPTVTEQPYDVEKDASIYSITYRASAGARPLPPAIPETPLAGMYGEIRLPRSSTDSDAPRSSVDSTSSFASSTSSNTSPLPSPSSPSFEGGLRSRWSSSTLASLAAEPSRGTTILSPLRNVFGSRTRRTPPPPKMPPHRTPPKHPKNKNSFSTTPSPPNNPGKHIRSHGSRFSTSSAGTSSNECDTHDGSPSRPKKKPIPVAMFLRTI